MSVLSTLTRRLIQVQNILLLWETLSISWNQGQDIDPSVAEAIHRDYQSIVELLFQIQPHPFQEKPEYGPRWAPLAL